MKTDVGNHKLSIAKRAETELPLLLVNYESGNLPALGTLCNAINVLDEFYQENSESEIAKGE